jgi:hypothetical protein
VISRYLMNYFHLPMRLGRIAILHFRLKPHVRHNRSYRGVLMKRLFLFPVVFVLTGCLSSRLDALGARMGDTNDQLRQINAKVDETNRRLESIDKSMKILVPRPGNNPAEQDLVQP